MPKKSKKRSIYNMKLLIGSFVLFIGIFVLSTSYTLTGFFVSNEETTSDFASSIIGIVLIISGISLIFLANRDEASQLEKKSLNPDGVYALTQAQKDKTVLSYDEIKSLAQKTNYEIREVENGFKLFHPDGTPVLGSTHKPIFVPKGSNINDNVYLRILEYLSNDAVKYSESHSQQDQEYRQAA